MCVSCALPHQLLVCGIHVHGGEREAKCHGVIWSGHVILEAHMDVPNVHLQIVHNRRHKPRCKAARLFRILLALRFVYVCVCVGGGFNTHMHTHTHTHITRTHTHTHTLHAHTHTHTHTHTTDHLLARLLPLCKDLLLCLPKGFLHVLLVCLWILRGEVWAKQKEDVVQRHLHRLARRREELLPWYVQVQCTCDGASWCEPSIHSLTFAYTHTRTHARPNTRLTDKALVKRHREIKGQQRLGLDPEVLQAHAALPYPDAQLRRGEDQW